ncbi:barstar family protein [Streptomyces sp. LP11]|uniref:Barstar family protein n=1 Tax=Streptomyces pyxinicus TaxID=2970331 RepID=A0ABT2B8X0_9ACTN|nr:barstar family protein [Streptomyces sp. LP11]MCS0604515.1 barstar family protein [Streptomyces sp. LP11]
MSEDPTGRFPVELDLGGVGDKAGLMDRVARALDLPDWFGRNWDALLDSLADPSVWPTPTAEPGRGLHLVVTGWRPYADARPDEWRVAREVFAEAAGRTAALTVTLAPE